LVNLKERLMSHLKLPRGLILELTFKRLEFLPSDDHEGRPKKRKNRVAVYKCDRKLDGFAILHTIEISEVSFLKHKRIVHTFE
jgi:hypothetical protein